MDNSKLILAGLDMLFPNPDCELNFNSPFELLVAVILSAQCTDKRVNMVTKELFKKYNSPQDFVSIPLEELEKLIHSCGFYHNKAVAIKKASKDIIERFNGEVPSDFDDLCSLSGVGRKTADVVLAERFGVPAFAVDTHVHRISKRLAIVPEDATVRETERILMSKVPKEDWIKSHHRMIFWGRYQCMARAPKCETCPLLEICQEGQKRIK